uniref:Uncharacterized protein n=1 Tax=Kalanchoe fedtschenkoi TaxID=63787 RepID=A0A7N0RG77_KALFE
MARRLHFLDDFSYANFSPPVSKSSHQNQSNKLRAWKFVQTSAGDRAMYLVDDASVVAFIGFGIRIFSFPRRSIMSLPLCDGCRCRRNEDFDIGNRRRIGALLLT